jgi:endoribonuclease Dicer
VVLCEQQRDVIRSCLPVPVGLISGALEPNQWKDHTLWRRVVSEHRVIVSTPQVLLDAMRNGHISLGHDIGLMIFDEAHHAADKHPYNVIMQEHYFRLPRIASSETGGSGSEGTAQIEVARPAILGLTASPSFGELNVFFH